MYVLFAVYAAAAGVLIGFLFRRLWHRHHDRAIQAKWAERENRLDHAWARVPRDEILAEPLPSTRDRHSQRHLQIVEREPCARVLFIVARDQRELVEFLHKDLAAEEAEGLIEIHMDRRRSPTWGALPREAERRRDPHRNRAVTTSLRETGCAFARQPAASPATALPITPFADPVALGR
jgi:hypothetical protein